MKSVRVLLLASSFLLASCGGNAPTETSSTVSATSISTTASTATTTSEVSNTVTFYDDDKVLYTKTSNADGYVGNPGTPLKKNYVFDGWKDENGKDFDFSMKAPAKLFAKWVLYEGLQDDEKLERYIARIQELCPTVSETRGYVESAYQYSVAEGVFTSVDVFTARRYADYTVITDHYFPKVCYVEDDLSDEERRLGLTMDEVNAKNKTLTVQEHYASGNLTTIYDYNEMHEKHDASDKDGKEIIAVKDAQIDMTLSIDFASYFMGWANQLVGLMRNASMVALPYFDENTVISDDFYYITPLNVSTLDCDSIGATFGFAYAITYESNDHFITNFYSSEGNFAFVNGKIRHCQVEKSQMSFIDGDALYSVMSLSVFDFNDVDDYPRFEGTLLDPADYDLYEE